MDWRKAAIEDLRKYPALKESVTNTGERIEVLESLAQSTPGWSDREPVSGGDTSRAEDRLIGNIVERQRLQLNRGSAAQLVSLIDRGLAHLDAHEYMVLERFYMYRRKGYVERLCEELNCEKTKVYEIKDAALKTFTIAMYGIVDL